jgi:protein TonB
MLALIWAAALAQEPPPVAAPSPPTITAPDWRRTPSAEDVARAYPERAVRKGVEGFSAIRCQVTKDGTMTGCVVVREEPSDAHFGEAALSLAPLFRLRPLQKNGLPVEGASLTIPIRFRLPYS